MFIAIESIAIYEHQKVVYISNTRESNCQNSLPLSPPRDFVSGGRLCIVIDLMNWVDNHLRNGMVHTSHTHSVVMKKFFWLCF